MREKPLDKDRLDTLFNTTWPQLETKFQETINIIKSSTTTEQQPHREMEDMVKELLEINRANSSRLERLEVSMTLVEIAALPSRQQGLGLTGAFSGSGEGAANVNRQMSYAPKHYTQVSGGTNEDVKPPEGKED